MELETTLLIIFTVCAIRFYTVILKEKYNVWKNDTYSKWR